MNRRLVCPECAPKPLGLTPLELRAMWVSTGRLWAKVAFSDGETVEHMWVQIVGFDGHDRVTGTLDSLPAVLDMRPGDVVTLDVAHISELYS